MIINVMVLPSLYIYIHSPQFPFFHHFIFQEVPNLQLRWTGSLPGTRLSALCIFIYSILTMTYEVGAMSLPREERWTWEQGIQWWLNGWRGRKSRVIWLKSSWIYTFTALPLNLRTRVTPAEELAVCWEGDMVICIGPASRDSGTILVWFQGTRGCPPIPFPFPLPHLPKEPD